MKPQTLKRWLIVAAVVYLLFPGDLIPDFLGRGLGLIDDLVLMAGLYWFYRKKLRSFATHAAREAAAPGESPPDPYATLGVPRTATQEAIREAYRARMREYHPDKVAHLGEELQQLAHQKALEIQRAFETLRE